MSEPERHLRAVTHVYDEQTGEVVDAATGELCQNPACVDLRDSLEQLTIQYAAICGNHTKLRNELARVTGVDPRADRIIAVGQYWIGRVVQEGWYSAKHPPKIDPGGPRWRAILSMLKKEYDEDYLRTAIDGKLREAKEQRNFQRHWLDLDSIFRNTRNVELAYEHARDPDRCRVERKDLPEWVATLPLDQLREELRPCNCGHPATAHSYPWAADGAQPCRWRGCDCRDFDDLDWRMAEFYRREAEQQKREAKRQ